MTQADVVLFAGLSGDFNPLHMDHSSAECNAFGQPVAHGLLGLAIASGLMSQAPRVDTLAFLAILEWRFLHPIFFGDTLHGISRVEALEPSGNGRRGVVTWYRRILNQEGKLVQEGRTQTLVRAARAVLAKSTQTPVISRPTRSSLVHCLDFHRSILTISSAFFDPK